MGNEFNGDDAAGIEVIRRLQQQLPEGDEFLLLAGGAAPENVTAPVRRFRPELVMFVDCADMGAEAGAVAWLDRSNIDGISAFTHILPLSVLAKYLQDETGCQIGIIGIQPKSLEFGQPLSKDVARAVDEIVA